MAAPPGAAARAFGDTAGCGEASRGGGYQARGNVGDPRGPAAVAGGNKPAVRGDPQRRAPWAGTAFNARQAVGRPPGGLRYGLLPTERWSAGHGQQRPEPRCPPARRGGGTEELACGSQAFIATLLFDPSMSALPIIPKQNSVSVGLFTH